MRNSATATDITRGNMRSAYDRNEFPCKVILLDCSDLKARATMPNATNGIYFEVRSESTDPLFHA